MAFLESWVAALFPRPVAWTSSSQDMQQRCGGEVADTREEAESASWLSEKLVGAERDTESWALPVPFSVLHSILPTQSSLSQETTLSIPIKLWARAQGHAWCHPCFILFPLITKSCFYLQNRFRTCTFLFSSARPGPASKSCLGLFPGLPALPVSPVHSAQNSQDHILKVNCIMVFLCLKLFNTWCNSEIIIL